jgi:hypothetical protein
MYDMDMVIYGYSRARTWHLAHAVTRGTCKGDATFGCGDVAHRVVRPERVHVGCDSIAPVVEMRARSHVRSNVEIALDRIAPG